MAAEYIREKFKNAGLELLFDNGFQKFSLVTSAEIGAGNKLTVNGKVEIEIDILGFKEVIDGVDRLAKQRNALGI